MSYSNEYSRVSIRSVSRLNRIPHDIADSYIYPMIAHHADTAEEKAYLDTIHAIQFRPIEILLNQLSFVPVSDCGCEFNVDVEGTNEILTHYHQICIEATRELIDDIDNILFPVSLNVDEMDMNADLLIYYISKDYSPMIDADVIVEFTNE